MTCHQDHPGTGRTLQGQPAKAVDFLALVKALGITRTAVVDPFQLDRLKETLREFLAAGEPSVIIARRPCALITKKPATPLSVKASACGKCRSCLRLGCPAISAGADGTVAIDPGLCTGCGLCASVCKFDAIRKAGEASA
jgi:indolepyruvate ferredoxin oxidoreductase alpha subunit